MSDERNRLDIVNPLGGALRHYVLELESTLEAGGFEVHRWECDEPSVSGEKKIIWVGRYLSCLVSAARARGRGQTRPVIVVWPVLGYLDVPVARAICSNAILFIHDPQPLVHAVGYGQRSKALARRLRKGVKAATHSEVARAGVQVDGVFEPAEIAMIAHPILRPRQPNELHTRGGSDKVRVVSVLGQFKAERDTDLLRSLAMLSPSDWLLRVVGRGWPAIEGWEVDSRFVPEEEFDEIIQASDVVLIPYRRFYQSGVAVRCLENCTPVVGPAESSLSDLLGADSALLAGDSVSSWLDAIEYAFGMPSTQVAALAMNWQKRSIAEYRQMVNPSDLLPSSHISR